MEGERAAVTCRAALCKYGVGLPRPTPVHRRRAVLAMPSIHRIRALDTRGPLSKTSPILPNALRARFILSSPAQLCEGTPIHRGRLFSAENKGLSEACRMNEEEKETVYIYGTMPDGQGG